MTPLAATLDYLATLDGPVVAALVLATSAALMVLPGLIVRVRR